MIFEEKKRTKFLGLPLYFTTYKINDDKINIRRGFLNITEDDAYMYKIQDVRLKRSLMERIFHLGTIVCFTGDTTHPELKITSVRRSDEIKEFILEASEEARRKRRTLHSLDIDAETVEDDLD